MPWKRRSLEKSKLYLILDTSVCDYDRLFYVLKQSAQAGADIVQLRDKRGFAKDIIRFSEKVNRFLKGRIPYIINDRVDLALACGASGVHLGQDDMPVGFARKLLGKKAIVGVSCQSLAHLKKATRDGADYIGFGSIFKTKTKPGRRPMDLKLLSEAVRCAPVPVFAIGGIDIRNVSVLHDRGIHRIAVCRAVCEAGGVKKAVKRFSSILDHPA